MIDLNSMPVFKKLLWSSLVIFILGIQLLNRSGKSKNEFIKVEGLITMISNNLVNANNDRTGKDRYIKLDNSERIFHLYIGKDWGDVKPKYEIIDSLELNDFIEVYYDDNLKTHLNSINNLTQFIDRDSQPIFVKGTFDKTMGKITIGLSILLAITILLLKKSGKIY